MQADHRKLMEEIYQEIDQLHEAISQIGGHHQNLNQQAVQQIELRLVT